MIDIGGRRLPVPRDEYSGAHRKAALASEDWFDLTQSMLPRAARLLLRLAETPLAWWSTLITLCVVLLAPLAVVDVPPLLDYPNHLARAYVLARGQQDAHLSQMYAPHWVVIPNLAVDLRLPPLISIMPVHIAGRILLAFALVLPVIGAVLYSQAVFARRSYWSIAVCLVACNGLFLLGFMNFQIAVGLAMVCAAAWLRWRETHPAAAIALGAICAGLLFFSHLMGLLFFLILLASHDIARAWEARRQGGSLIPAIARRFAWSLLIVVLPAVLYAVSAFSDNAPDVSWESWPDKLTRASMSLVNYNLPLDIVSAGLLAAFLLTCARLRLIVVPLGSAVALGVVALLFVASPFGFKGGGYLDARFAVMFGFLLCATILPMRLPRRPALLAAIAIVALFSLRTAHVAAVWYAHNRDLAQLRDAISAVEPGSRVLLAMVGIDEAVPAQREFMRRQYLSDGSRLDAHTAALLLIERHAFWAVLFANSEQQPIELRSPHREIANRTAGILDIRLLSASSPDPRDLATFPLEGQWSCCYDYVLLLEAAARPDFSHDNLELLRKSDYASLFRIRQHAPWVELLSRRDTK